VEYQVTVRYGSDRQRYHLFTLIAPGLVEALRAAARALPPEVADTADLVEIRPAVTAEARPA
jgi:hypothetical protein